jgi:hypothetical protein
VKEDENGNYVPVDPSVVPEKNVFVMLAPISADMSAPLTDEERNLPTKKNLDGWTSLTDKCILWTYSANFSRKLFFFDHFHVLAENYKIAKQYKFKWLLYEKRTYKGGTAFRDLLAYLHSNLAWKVDLDINELISDFMGLHVDPYMLRYVRKIKGDDKIILISDQFVSDGPVPAGYEECTDIHFDFAGEIAGSGLTLDIACRNFMYHTGCSVCEAFKFASYNPSRALGLYDVGSIEVGNKANLIVVDQFFNVKKIMIKGDIL